MDAPESDETSGFKSIDRQEEVDAPVRDLALQEIPGEDVQILIGYIILLGSLDRVSEPIRGAFRG